MKSIRFFLGTYFLLQIFSIHSAECAFSPWSWWITQDSNSRFSQEPSEALQPRQPRQPSKEEDPIAVEEYENAKEAEKPILKEAIRRGDLEQVEKSLRKFPVLGTEPFFGSNIFHFSARYRRLDVFKLVESLGPPYFDPRALYARFKEGDWETPLDVSMHNGMPEITEHLLDVLPLDKINFRLPEDHFTAFERAFCNGDTTRVRMFLAKLPAEVIYQRDWLGRNFLHRTGKCHYDFKRYVYFLRPYFDESALKVRDYFGMLPEAYLNIQVLYQRYSESRLPYLKR